MGKFFGLLLVLILGCSIAMYFYYENVSQETPNTIPVSGNIEITEVDVSFKVAGRVHQRLVDEGNFVEAGQLVATLEDTDFLHDVAVQEAEVQTDQASLLEQERGYLPEEIAQAEARVQQATADFDRLESDYKRQKQLYEQDVISRREFESSQSAYEVGQAKIREAVKYFDLLKKGTRPERIDQARARLGQAQQNLIIAQTRLGYTRLYSPLSGMVIAKNIEPGEYVAVGTPIVTIGDIDHPWLRGYVSETDLGKIKLGQTVQIKTDTFPDKIYEGQIVFISPQAEFTPKNVQTEKERVKLVYRIKINVNNRNRELKPGMPADGTILIDSQSQNFSLNQTRDQGQDEYHSRRQSN